MEMNAARGCREFSTDLHKILTKTTAGNVVHSPFGIHLLLSYLSRGADGLTAKEMISELYLTDIETFHIGYKNLINEINKLENSQDKENTMTVANALFVDEKISLMKDFQAIGTDCYKFALNGINFDNKNETVKVINRWASEKTQNRITDIVTPEDIEDNTKVMLMNAIYFKARWESPFKKFSTHRQVFHLSETSEKKVPTMSKCDSCNYGELPNMQSTFIEMPYMNGDMNMTVILPNTIEGLKFAEKRFDWDSVIKAKTEHRLVSLRLPKFKVKATLDLKKVLSKMGMKSMFEPRGDFEGISPTKLIPPMHVSGIIQTVFLDVDEDGTEAAAITRLRMRGGGESPKPTIFHVDRPFIVVVRHVPSGIPLFISSVRDIDEDPTWKPTTPQECYEAFIKRV